MGNASFTWYDYDGERGGSSINTVDLSGANFDAQATAVTALRAAMNGLTLVNVSKALISDINWNNLVPVADPQAQREIKWVVVVADTLGNKYRAMEIPIANLDLLENNSKYIVKQGVVTVTTAATAVQAFIDAFEAVAVDKFGNALQVWDVYQAGRNT